MDNENEIEGNLIFPKVSEVQPVAFPLMEEKRLYNIYNNYFRIKTEFMRWCYLMERIVTRWLDENSLLYRNESRWIHVMERMEEV